MKLTCVAKIISPSHCLHLILKISLGVDIYLFSLQKSHLYILAFAYPSFIVTFLSFSLAYFCVATPVRHLTSELLPLETCPITPIFNTGCLLISILILFIMYYKIYHIVIIYFNFYNHYIATNCLCKNVLLCLCHCHLANCHYLFAVHYYL